MPYNRNRVPDSPMTPGMLTPATELHDSDFVILIQPVNDPGQKTRTTTLSQLAGYIAGGGVSSITFTGENGYTATASGEGFNYHKDATQEDQAARDFGIDDDGIHATVTTSNYTKKFEVLPDGVRYSKTAGGLTNKVEIFEDYVLITHQVQNGATVETHTSRIGWDSMRAPVLNVMQDENNNIPISWDVTNGELVIWQQANSGKVAVPKLHVYGTLDVEKDTTIDADLNVKKTLHVTQSSTFDGQAEFNDYVISKKGLDSKGKSVFERINAGSSKSYFEVNEDESINTLLANTTIPVSKGDIVTILNTSDNSVTITMGTREGSGGLEYKHTTLNSLCAMQFICVLHQVTQSATYNQWAPLGNATVTWS